MTKKQKKTQKKSDTHKKHHTHQKAHQTQLETNQSKTLTTQRLKSISLKSTGCLITPTEEEPIT